MKQAEKIIVSSIITVLAIWSIQDAQSRMHFRGSTTSKQQACFSNIYTLTNAMDEYNMDCSSDKILKSYNERLDKMLLDKKYLKEEIVKPNPKCEYVSEGDLLDNGFIYCKFHGDTKNSLNIWNRDKARAEIRGNINLFLFGLCVFVVSYIFSCFINFIFSFFRIEQDE